MTIDNYGRKIQLTWFRIAALTVIAMLAGLFIQVAHPVYLQPPFYRLTDVIYATIAMLWLPLFIACFWTRPTGNRSIPVVLLILFVPMFLFGTFDLGTSLLVYIANQPDCTQQPAPGDRVRYICKVADDAPVFESFEGSPGSPFMYPVVLISPT